MTNLCAALISCPEATCTILSDSTKNGTSGQDQGQNLSQRLPSQHWCVRRHFWHFLNSGCLCMIRQEPLFSESGLWFRSDNFQKWILAYVNNNLALFGIKICSKIVHSERGSRFLPQTLSIREAKFSDCVARRELWAFKEHNVQRQMSYLAYFCAKFRLWCVPYPSNNTLIEKITWFWLTKKISACSFHATLVKIWNTSTIN